MKNNSKHVKNDFLDWLEGILDDTKEKEVNQHLKNCESCHLYYVTMQNAMEKPNNERIPVLEKDPYLPVKIKQRAKNRADCGSVSVFGFPKKVMGTLVAFGLLLGFLMGQLLIYSSQYNQDSRENRTVSEIFYEGVVQPDLGSNFEKVITNMEDDL